MIRILIWLLKGLLLFTRRNWLESNPHKAKPHSMKWLAFLAIDAFVASLPVRKKRRGLCVILVNRLGDAIVSRQLITALSQTLGYRLSETTVIGDFSWKILERNVYRDIRVYFIDEYKFRTRLFYRLRIALHLRFQAWETCVCFMHVRLEMRDDAMVFLSRADRTIVAELPFILTRWYPWVFEHYLSTMTEVVVPINIDTLGTEDPNSPRNVPHVLERQSAFWKTVSGDHRQMPITPLTLPLLNKHDTLFEKINGRPYVILNVGASGIDRRWPISEWIKLCDFITDQSLVVCFLGGPEEVSLGDTIRKKLELDANPRDDVMMLFNVLSPNQLLRLIADAECFVGPDTGTSHIAFFLKVRMVLLHIVDPSHSEWFRCGDFFPYPKGFYNPNICYISSTFDQFHCRNGNPGVFEKVTATLSFLIKT